MNGNTSLVRPLLGFVFNFILNLMFYSELCDPKILKDLALVLVLIDNFE